MTLAVERLYVKNFGCLREVDLSLGALHALIGPNDSGKSTILKAARLAVLRASGGDYLALKDTGRLFDRAVETAAADEPYLSVAYGERGRGPAWEFFVADRRLKERLVIGGQTEKEDDRVWNSPSLVGPGRGPAAQAVYERVKGGPLALRLDPDALREPGPLLPRGSKVLYQNDRGVGLAGIYDLILKRGDDSFSAIRDQVRRLFPSVHTIRVQNIPQEEWRAAWPPSAWSRGLQRSRAQGAQSAGRPRTASSRNAVSLPRTPRRWSHWSGRGASKRSHQTRSRWISGSGVPGPRSCSAWGRAPTVSAAPLPLVRTHPHARCHTSGRTMATE